MLLSVTLSAPDYAAVLTGPPGAAAATARLYFRKKTLQYSFLFGEGLGWPTHLTFLDGTQDIIEGEPAPPTLHDGNFGDKLNLWDVCHV